MADHKKVDKSLEGEPPVDDVDTNIAVTSSEVCSVAGSVRSTKTQRMSTSSDRQVKFERAQKALENAALVSKRIKEHRKATAELLGRPFEDDDIGDTAEVASTVSERTGYSVATDTSTTLSVQEALNIPGISESLANTLKQKELLMERIKQYKEISRRPTKTTPIKKEAVGDSKLDLRKTPDQSDTTRLMNTIKEKENVISVIQVKMKAMETTILDLQETINEKNQIIEAKNMATTLMSDSLSKKEKDSLLLLEDTRQQMTKMQENFIIMETEWKEEKQRLIKDIELKDEKIHNLEEANTILENSRFEITVAHSKLLEALDLKNKEITQLQESLKTLSEEHSSDAISKENEDFEQEKGSLEISNMVELSKKIELLEQINCQIRQTNIELENKLATINSESKSPATSSPSKKASPLPGRKGGRNTAAKMKSPWSNLSSESLPQETEKKGTKNEIMKLEMLVQSLNKDILEKEYVISQKDALIIELESINASKEAAIIDLQSTQTETSIDRVDTGVLTEPMEIISTNPDKEVISETKDGGLLSLDVVELEEKLKAAQQQIISLNDEVDLANKNMIKVKSSHKLKIKQMQKTIDNFSKLSDSNAEIVKLNEEMHQLTQKVAELEEEKGNLQLHLVDYDSGRLTESDIYKKMIEMENIAETRLKAISVLETQKFDLVQDLHVLQQKNLEMEDKLADMVQLQNEQVCSEIKSVQLEEQVDELTASRKEFELIIENLKLDKDQLNSAIKNLQDEKEELIHKLESYIQENMELTDKLEKLSTEKVSSAESIEIVESLTTQEKLELEEYNQGMMETKGDSVVSGYQEDGTRSNEKSIESLVEQTVELNKKIELFNQERQEVMDKMSKISAENETLQDNIVQVNNLCSTLQNNIDLLNNEKHELQALNSELNKQIEELKRERIEILKETTEVAKPSVLEEHLETSADTQQDDKGTGEKGGNRNKSVKQLTKEILKLKNTIKEREAEIADSQMKILSLEEQQQKQNELIQTNASFEAKVKCLIEENQLLKEKIKGTVSESQLEEQQKEFQQANDLLQEELQRTRQEYSNTISTRDNRIHELENLLVEYEKQIFNYGNSLQQKDKEMVDYLNQITKLNDVSQKLKSTIEVLEEEKAQDQNAELVKSLNKQISVYQKRLTECEEKLKNVEDEKTQLMSIKVALENKNVAIETELKKVQDSYVEKQNLIKELQVQQQKHSGEVAEVMLQAKEREEELHEIKLQLRKESIENEKLRNAITEKEKSSDEFLNLIEDSKNKVNQILSEKEQLSEHNLAIETKNKELLEKLKKFAVNIKKKSSMYTELENQFHEVQKQLEARESQLEQLSIQVETLPALQEKLKHADEEINRLQGQKVAIEQQKTEYITQLEQNIKYLEEKLSLATEEITKLHDAMNKAHKEFSFAHDENIKLKAQIDQLNNKLVEHEIEQKNSMNLSTKLLSLEVDNNQKQTQIVELLHKLENQEQVANQLQFGHEAKVQERDLYIESLETEINKYKTRICRLEESISIMEDRRHSLERKADQLDNQLLEKQKAYNEYSDQEDGLVNRLAVLMDHDSVVEKQLHEIEHENRYLQDKLQDISEENQSLRKTLSEMQENYATIAEKANRSDALESEIIKLQTQLRDMDAQLKRTAQEHQTMMSKKRQDIEDIESEFNTQIENAIKEKKALSEKYEKIAEHVSQLEAKLQEYRTENERLKINIEDLNRVNQDIFEKSAVQQSTSPDYTEQYVSEINKLNSLVNNKNQEIQEINNKFHILQVNSVATVANFESKVNDLTNKLQQSTSDVDQLIHEIHILKEENEQLQAMISQKEDQFKELQDRKKVSFEMNIPKTEGLIISSTIEAMNAEEPKKCDVFDLESQIISDVSSNYSDGKKEPESIQKQALVVDADSKTITEEIIVPKKAYLCYQGDEKVSEETDPFNSDEGWGLGEAEDMPGDVVPGFSHLNEQITNLQNENEKLKSELNANNLRLVKVMKKLKEFKANNERLSNELKLSRQVSQSLFLDNAIEDELRNNISELEKKIEELNTDLQKEKRDKETVKKQNDVFNNANEKLLEMKEKLDNEVELWKFKFKEVNDKMSTLQWGADSKDSPVHKIESRVDVAVGASNSDIIKLEKENDELQSIVDELASENKKLLSQETKLKNEIETLSQQLKQQKSCLNCDSLNINIDELKSINAEVTQTNALLKEKLQEFEVRYNEAITDYENLKQEKQESDYIHENNKQEFILKCKDLDDEMQIAKKSENEAKTHIESLKTEISTLNHKIQAYEDQHVNAQHQDSLVLSEKLSALENYCSELKVHLDESADKVSKLESLNLELEQKLKEHEQKSEDLYHLKSNLEETNIKTSQLDAVNHDLQRKVESYESQIAELTSKLQSLSTENDQLLSNVVELRSSMTSAVDQRGFEIAELWKQHLAQREADFLKTEQELRTEISASETKYDQLLDSVQSSSQEETNKLIVVEQVNSLQNKLQDKEEHLRDLQDKYGDVINQLDLLRSEIEDEKVMYENKLLAQQDEYEKIIQNLIQKNKEHANDYEQNFKSVQDDLATKNDDLRQQVEDLTGKLKEIEATVLDLNNQLRLKESEIYQKTQEYTMTLAQRNEDFDNVRKQLLEFEKKVEDLSYEKEAELAVLRLKMHDNGEYYGKSLNELNTEKTTVTEALNLKIVECTNLNKQIADLNKLLEENSNKAKEMQTALENQELEIVTLKDEISTLEQMFRKATSKIEKHVTFSSDTKPSPDGESSEGLINKDLLDAVPRAELDLALYMLHQRDVRCEELTMELTHLLEERDTLQLRLSDSLRSNEDLKTRMRTSDLDVSTDSHETVSELASFSADREQTQFVDIHRGQSSRSSSVSEVDGDKPKLQAKLSELRSVRHSRDVRFRQESEQRQIDMRLLQRDVANLPPEAVDQLAQAHHTLSRDSQSTSTVLLNWLRGKSTPKVVHM